MNFPGEFTDYVTLGAILIGFGYFLFKMQARAETASAAMQVSIDHLAAVIDRTDATDKLLQAINELRRDLKTMRDHGSQEHGKMIELLQEHARSHERIETKIGLRDG